MENVFIWSALALGFLGSLHCIGMCGPIAMALPTGGHSPAYAVRSRLLYNLGRVTTYAALGFATGWIGFGLSLQGFQSELSIATGIVIIVVVLLGGKRGIVGKQVHLLARFTVRLKRLFRRYFGSGSALASFMIGLFNGILPCGFVYLALAGAMATGHYVTSAAYMALFGLGTLPAMFFAGIAGQLLGTGFSRFFKKASPVIALAIAFLLIYRGDALTKKACMHGVKATESTMNKTVR